MYIYMYSLLLGRLSVNSFGWLTQRASFYWRKLSTEKTEEQYSRTRPFYKDCPHKCTLSPSVMSSILWLWDWAKDGGKQELLFACLTETIQRWCGCNGSRASSLLLADFFRGTTSAASLATLLHRAGKDPENSGEQTTYQVWLVAYLRQRGWVWCSFS